MQIVIATCSFLCLLQLSFSATRKYYLAAVELSWDYVHSDLLAELHVDTRFPPPRMPRSFPFNKSVIYKKTVFVEFTDQHFNVAKPRTPWMGLLGPTIQAEVHDTVVIILKNMASHPVSLHAVGVSYWKVSEGAEYNDQTSEREKEDDKIFPGGSHTYVWQILKENGPMTSDPPCLTYSYLSHVDLVKDLNSGLIGALLVCREGTLAKERSQTLHEFVLLFAVFDEGQSWHSGTLPAKSATAEAWPKMHTVNGYVNRSLPGLIGCHRKQVYWHVIGMGTTPEVHSIFLEGHTFLVRNHRQASLEISPLTFLTAQTLLMDLGQFLLFCHISSHQHDGMEAYVKVDTCPEEPQLQMKSHKEEEDYNSKDSEMHVFTFDDDNSASFIQIRSFAKKHPKTWIHYIAAEEVDWDYAPSVPTPDDRSYQSEYLNNGPQQIGRKYKKVRFMPYTDETFKTHETVQYESGILGPLLYGEVGDTLLIIFKNQATRPYNIYPHGITDVSPLHSGKLPKGIKHLKDLPILPGEIFKYKWKVTIEDGPTKSDPRCLTRYYSSFINPDRDLASGLIGPLLICYKESVDQRGNQMMSDKRNVILFSVFDENQSWYFTENMQRFLPEARGGQPQDPEFQASNIMHSINGYVFASLQLSVCLHEVAYWYILSVGAQTDFLSIFFSGYTFKHKMVYEDTLTLFPFSGETVFMSMENPGLWVIGCHNSDFRNRGMTALLRVYSCDSNTGDYDEDEDTETHFIEEYNGIEPRSFSQNSRRPGTKQKQFTATTNPQKDVDNIDYPSEQKTQMAKVQNVSSSDLLMLLGQSSTPHGLSLAEDQESIYEAVPDAHSLGVIDNDEKPYKEFYLRPELHPSGGPAFTPGTGLQLRLHENLETTTLVEFNELHLKASSSSHTVMTPPTITSDDLAGNKKTCSLEPPNMPVAFGSHLGNSVSDKKSPILIKPSMPLNLKNRNDSMVLEVDSMNNQETSLGKNASSIENRKLFKGKKAHESASLVSDNTSFKIHTTLFKKTESSNNSTTNGETHIDSPELLIENSTSVQQNIILKNDTEFQKVTSLIYGDIFMDKNATALRLNHMLNKITSSTNAEMVHQKYAMNDTKNFFKNLLLLSISQKLGLDDTRSLNDSTHEAEIQITRFSKRKEEEETYLKGLGSQTRQMVDQYVNSLRMFPNLSLQNSIAEHGKQTLKQFGLSLEETKLQNGIIVEDTSTRQSENTKYFTQMGCCEEEKRSQQEEIDYDDTISSEMKREDFYIYGEDEKLGPRSFEKRTRHYFIAAVERLWDYGMGTSPHAVRNSVQGGSALQFKKVVFQEFTDGSFTQSLYRGELNEHLGILGPYIRAEVEDNIVVTFKNQASRPYSFYSSLISYKEDKRQGAEPRKNFVKPNETKTYFWEVQHHMAPTNDEFDCKAWAYFSDVDLEKDMHSGLIGPLLICRANTLNPAHGRQVTVQEFALFFTIFDETKSWYFIENMERNCRTPCNNQIEDPIFKENFRFHAINGYVMDTLPGLVMAQDQRIRWYLLSMGSNENIHSIHFSGHVFTVRKKEEYKMAVYNLYPGAFETVEMLPSKAGIWRVECLIGEHLRAGMSTLFLVYNKNCQIPLGMASGHIQDFQITASGQYGQWAPKLARLHYSGSINAWSTKEPFSWIKVDLLTPMIIHGIKTQGARQKLSSLYISQFIIMYSLDGKKWQTYRGNSTGTLMVCSPFKQMHESFKK